MLQRELCEHETECEYARARQANNNDAIYRQPLRERTCAYCVFVYNSNVYNLTYRELDRVRWYFFRFSNKFLISDRT